METNKNGMTIGQFFTRLEKQAETWTDEQKLQFKKAWLRGSERNASMKSSGPKD